MWINISLYLKYCNNKKKQCTNHFHQQHKWVGLVCRLVMCNRMILELNGQLVQLLERECHCQFRIRMSSDHLGWCRMLSGEFERWHQHLNGVLVHGVQRQLGDGMVVGMVVGIFVDMATNQLMHSQQLLSKQSIFKIKELSWIKFITFETLKKYYILVKNF